MSHLVRVRPNALQLVCALALIGTFCGKAFGQSTESAPFTLTSPGKLTPVHYLQMPAVDGAAMRQEDDLHAAQGMKVQRFGISHPVQIGSATHGAWDVLPNGLQVWRTGIACPGALSVNLVFTHFAVPAGGRVFVVNEDGEQQGPFTAESVNGTDVLGVAPVTGERVIVEYQLPAHTVREPLIIGQVTHGYRDPYADIERGFGASGSCNNNVICPAGDPWRSEIRSVARIINGGDWCTGTLMNNCSGNGTPYMLTANHCVSGQSNFASWVFQFNWESPTCTPTTNAATNHTVSGSSLLASGAGSDYALLQLNSAVPAAYSPYYSGWDHSGTTPTSLVCIHHPNGDIKKITFDNNAPGQSTVNLGNGNAQCWHVFNYESGTTEPGSSGSGVWDQNHRLVGQLYGGTASCSNNIDDYYGRFDLSFPNLTTWLGNCGNALNGYDPSAPTVNLDAQLSSITNFTGSTCTATRTPSVVMRNGGVSTLTSFTLTWSLNNGANTNVPWSGSLASGSSVTVALPTMALISGSNTLTVTVSAPNGGADQATSNDQATATTAYGTNTVVLNLNLDRYGDETTWQILQGSTVFASGGPYTQQASNGVYPQTPISVCLPDGCYDLKVMDAFGDGMCCSFGNGNYNLTFNGSTLVNGSGSFTTSATTNFCVAGSVQVSPRIYLEGAYVQAETRMQDSLRVKGLVPLTEPYTGLGYAHTGGGGGEVTTAGVLAVTGNNAIVDWVLVELRNSTTPHTIVASHAALLQRDGDVVGTDGTSPVAFAVAPGNYYVAVRHRNHLGTMRSSTVALSSTTTTVDLTTSATSVYGTNARKTIGSVQVLWAGDVSFDHTLKYTGANNDRDPILVRIGSVVPTNTVNGYYQEDVNMTGKVAYTGASNDRDPILVNIGSVVPTNTVSEQLP